MTELSSFVAAGRGYRGGRAGGGEQGVRTGVGVKESPKMGLGAVGGGEAMTRAGMDEVTTRVGDGWGSN